MDALRIDGTYNARALGGDRPWIIRSAALDALTAAGEETLRGLDACVVLDLREHQERGAAVHGLPVRHLPLYRSPEGAPRTGGLEEIYTLLLTTRGAELTEAVAAIAAAPGPVVVHCTAGKDRTGLVVALALLAAGWSRTAVIADYARSGATVRLARRSIVDEVLAPLGLSPDAHAAALRLHLDSPAEALEHALDLLDAHGGAVEYLRGHGLADPQLRRLQELLGRAAA